ncbi:hypothetical protein WBJ53_04770 [Spirosoma sp. SC4-14]|uniref:hypothetical protein n=1 Tax=Spirosoma sp. SC4-14 TaxID=3128900 RepID=UPI0030D62BDF
MLTLPVSEALTLRLYDSIKELPTWLHLEARQYAILQSALATTAEELSRRGERLALLEQYGLKAEHQLESYNYQLSARLLAEGYNPYELEWACYLQAINDSPLGDYSEDELVARLTRLKQQGLAGSVIESSLASIKQRLLVETKRYYPRRLGSGHYNQLQRQKSYALALAAYYESASEAAVQALEGALLSVLRSEPPVNLLDGPGNGLVSLEKSQFRLYTSLSESGCPAPDQLSVYAFYGWIEVLEERYERQQAALHKPNSN